MPLFIGREAELARLDDALAGRTSTPGLFLAGEAGLGKTRLVEEFGRRAEEAGATVAIGGCLELGADVLPLAPFVEALSRLYEGLGSSAGSVVGSAGAELSVVIPELGLPPPRPDRIRLFEAVRSVLERAPAPVILILEDIHWIDHTSLELLSYLVRRLRYGHVLVIATFRNEELGADHAAPTVLAELVRSGRASRVDLPPLPRAQVEQLVTALDPEASAELIAVAVAKGDGNPFLVRLIVLGGDPSGGTATQVLRDLLLAGFRGLGEEARSVLELAAVVGRPFDPILLEQAWHGPPERLAVGLRAALDHGVLVRDRPAGMIAFRHALLADAAEADLLPAERATLHDRVARLLAERPELATPTVAGAAAELARHWYAARCYPEAIGAAVRAADAAVRVPAHVEALLLYRRALELWDRVDEPVTAAGIDLADLADRAAAAAFAGGRFEEATTLERRAIDACDADADPTRAGILHAVLAKWLGWSYQLDAMRDAAERAVRLLPAARPSQGRALALAAVASVRMHDGRFESAAEVAAEAAAMAGACGDPATEAWARAVLGATLGHRGRDADGLAEADRAVAIAGRSGDVWSWWISHANRRDMLLMLGWRPELAEREIRAWRAAALRLDVADAFEVDWRLAELLLWFGLGRWDAVEIGTSALISRPEPARNGAGQPYSGWAHALRGTVRVLRGALAEGESDLEVGLAAPAASCETLIVRPRRGLAEAALLRRRPELALRWVDEDLEAFEGTDGVLDIACASALGIRAAADLVEQRLARRDSAAAAAARDVGEVHRDRLADVVRASGVPGTAMGRGPAAFAAWGQAEALRLARGSDADAWAAAAHAVGQWNRPHLLPYARFREAEAVLGTRRDRVRGAAALRDASDRADALGLVPLQAAITDLARRARIDPWAPVAVSSVSRRTASGAAAASRPEPDRIAATTALPPDEPADPWGLSPREREVLACLVEGRTNREIGAALFISETTASVHVTHILNKLGVTSRGAAAAAAAQAGFGVAVARS